MKKLLQKMAGHTLRFTLIFMIIVACNKDDTPDIEKQDPIPNPDGIEQDSVVRNTEDLLTMDTSKTLQSPKSSKRRKL